MPASDRPRFRCDLWTVLSPSAFRCRRPHCARSAQSTRRWRPDRSLGCHLAAAETAEPNWRSACQVATATNGDSSEEKRGRLYCSERNRRGFQATATVTSSAPRPTPPNRRCRFARDRRHGEQCAVQRRRVALLEQRHGQASRHRNAETRGQTSTRPCGLTTATHQPPPLQKIGTASRKFLDKAAVGVAGRQPDETD